MELKDIKQQLSITTVLQHYNLQLDKNSRLLCPFHNDKNPSLQVYPKTNTYCCFSSNCKAGTGDSIQFIQLKENCSKHEALVKASAMVTGNAITPQSPAAKLFIEPAPIERETTLIKSFSIFTKALTVSKQAVAYLQSRGLDYKQHETGFISERYHHDISKELQAAFATVGLLKPSPVKGYTVWAKGCIIFPLKDIENKIVSLYGRSITDNENNRHFYLQNRTGLYPGYPALQTKKLILTESIIDAASLLQQEEVKNNYTILSLYGTNGLTDEHIKAIIELPQLEEIILMLDADEAGEAATAKHTVTLKQLLPETKISKVILPAGEDVNSVLCTHDDAKVY